MLFGPRIAKKWLQTWAKSTYSDHLVHAQSLIQAFVLHWYILKKPVILLADSEGPDQTKRMSENTFLHGAAHFNSFGAKFQTTFVVCFFCNKLSLGKKLICKVERLDVKLRRSRWDGSYEPSHLDLCCLQSLLLSPLAVQELIYQWCIAKEHKCYF